MQEKPIFSLTPGIRALFCLLAVHFLLATLGCAPKVPPRDVGLPTGYERLEGGTAVEPEFEIPPAEFDAAELLPVELLHGPHHAVRGVRLDHGFMYVFDVESEDGHFDVTSHGLLHKRVLELEALAELRESQPGSTRLFAYEVANEALEPIEGALQILRHPIRTVTNVPKGVASSAKALWEMKELGRTHLEDDYVYEFMGLAGERRDWAQDMGVDPYTTNPHVQRHLKKNSWISLAGRTTVQLATIAIPTGAASFALTAVGATSGMSEALQDVAPEDIRVTTRRWLRDTLNVDEETATRFLEHPWYTPTRQEIIIRALARLEDVKHRDRFIVLASRADEPHETHAFARMALMLAEFDARTAKLDELFVSEGLLMAHTTDGGVVLPLYMDHGYWTKEVAEAEREISRFLGWDREIRQKSLLISGALSARARHELEARAWTVSDQVESDWLAEIDVTQYRPVGQSAGRILPELGH